MARGRKFRSARRAPESERALFEQKLNGRYSRTLDRNDLLNLIRGGEDTYLEFKIRLVNLEKVTAEIVALANAGGGAIVFGVNDQRRLEGLDDPEQVEEQLIDICRNNIKPPLFPRIDKVSFDNGTRVVVLQVDDRRAPHQTPDHRFFIRIGSTKREADGGEIAALYARSRVASFEDMPLLDSSIEDIDEALVWSYIRDLEGESFREPEGFPTGNAMLDLRLASEVASSGVPSLAGLLLFGRNAAVERLLPYCSVTLTRFSGTDTNAPVVERVNVFGNLTRLLDRSLAFISRYADLWEARPPRSQVRKDGEAAEPVDARRNYSKAVVVEAMRNMLVHRDYSVVSASRVAVFDNRIEIVNPCRVNGSTKKAVEYGAISRANPRIHHVFTSSEYGAEPGTRGVPALRRAQLAFARREPRLSLLGDEFRMELAGV
jgi:ATP-dependent DNA helicase RecG